MTVLIIPQTSGDPITITVDATVSETHENSATITEDPVESGPSTSDHYKADLATFNLSMIFSDQPIKEYPDFTDGVSFEMQSDSQKAFVLLADRESDRSQRVYDAITKSQAEGVLIQVITTRRSYSNVGIRKIRVTRDKNTGKALSIDCECRVLRLVETTTTTAAIPRRPRGRARSNNGARTGTEDTAGTGDEATRESVWHRLANP